MFAGRNSDTWMRTVRLLITDSASPLSPHLGRRGGAQRHTLAVTLARARACARKCECTAGGHLSAGQIKAGKVKSSSAQKSVQSQTEKCTSVCRVEEFTIVFPPSLELVVDVAPPQTLLSTRVTNRRIKTNLKVTVASVTVASGVPPTLQGGRSIWQVLCMRGVLIDESHLAASKHTDRVETCVVSNSWRRFQKSAG